MEQGTYKFIIDRKNNSWIFDFGNEYRLIVDFNMKMAYRTVNGETKDQFSISGMLLETFDQILLNTEKSLLNHTNQN